VNKSTDVIAADGNAPAGGAEARSDAPTKRATWAQIEGSPLPLGVTWIEEEQAFNFVVHAEHAESVTLLFYSAEDVANPCFTFRFDFLRNKWGRIWHCRIALGEMGDACYYAYSVSGETRPQLHSFDPQKILLDPYAKCIFFHPVLTANWLCGKDQTQDGRPWEC
jgi:glycogen operon protein